jgi:hypothetical protein
MKQMKYILSMVLVICPLAVFAFSSNIYEPFSHNEIYHSEGYNKIDNHFNDSYFPYSDNELSVKDAAINCQGRLCEACGVGTLDAACQCSNPSCEFYGDFCISCDQVTVPIGDAILPILLISILYTSYRILREKNFRNRHCQGKMH